ncbi:Retrovirus-related Pol polyprotein from transposon TNT 1-94 [Erysiphe neolycopersici]|uniref:Retrovirus-related Pol polyprotein from transposon TNT 1-94 n=1 Tax=Erysiphe neolycopersici TaxID=212602 RepID=A0A420HVA2_9PEZI|nr:Retrovirus-related Pol polyprotein from transposon TNT 1-94 [Erysiphe neolycopersici]
MEEDVKLKSNTDYSLSAHQSGSKTKNPQYSRKCLAGNMKETYSKKTDNRSLKIVSRLHSEISGKLPSSLRGYNYFLIVIDDASRCGWLRLLKNKSTAECLPAIKEIIAHLQLTTGEKVAFFTADNGSGEFVQPSPRLKQSQNGVAERAIGFLVQLANSMIFHAQLNWKTCWCYAIEHAMYVRNRLPTSALPYGPKNTRSGSNITPVTAFSDKMLSLKKLGVFECSAYLLIFKETKPATSKFVPNMDTDWIFVIKSSRKTLGPYHKQAVKHNNRVNGNLGRAQIDYNRVDGDSHLKLQNYNSRVSGDSSLDINVRNCDKEANKFASFLNNPNIQMVTRSGKVARLNPSNQSKKVFGNNSALMVKALNAS